MGKVTAISARQRIDWDALSDAVERVEITTAEYSAAMTKLETCYKRARRRAKRNCAALLGESHTGKTFVIENFVAKHPPTRDENGLTCPVLWVEIPPKPEKAGFLALLLKALGDQHAHRRARIGELEERLIRFIRGCGVILIILEEFQHVADHPYEEVVDYITNYLKTLIQNERISIVISGLPHANATLLGNEQLRGRFSRPIYMRRLDWRSSSARRTYRAVLGLWQKGLEPFELPDLESEEMSFRFYLASGGLMGYVAKILRQAVQTAAESRRTIVTLKDLAHAYDEEVHEHDVLFGNPFTIALDAKDIQVDRLKEIGTKRPTTRRGHAKNGRVTGRRENPF
ncbi:MAG TPA: TniB family NTP-binding protein [Gammaproteobacteria bacterium]